MKRTAVILLFAMLFLPLFAQDREIGEGVSGPVSINTIMGGTGYDISGPVTINTMQNAYSDYRIVPVSQAPNPAVLEIPEGGYGYAWFVVEGQLEGAWLPVMGIDLLAEDEQGNIIQCETGRLPYQFLTSIVHMQNAGVFAVPVSHDIIGSGAPGNGETITVIKANGEIISPDNQQCFDCEIIPYEYTASWGYRMYAHGGAGLTGGVVTATGFAGGGSGSKIELQLDGLSNNPNWSAFKIYRRDDLFVGADVKLGPPLLLDVGTAKVSTQASFPYQHEYEFDLDQLEGLEALMAFYLFAEPTIVYGGSVVPGGQIAVNFLSWIVQALIENNAENGLGISRVSDETGLDIKGSMGLSVNFLDNLPLGMNMGAGLGASAHLGGSKKVYTNGTVKRRFYLGGEYKANAGIGPKIVPANKVAFSFFYPQRLAAVNPNVNLGVDFQVQGTWSNDTWQSIKLSGSLESNLGSLNLYDLPGQVQGYSAWIDIDSANMKNMLLNVAETPQEMWNIGTAAVNASANNETFRQDIMDFLEVVYEEQNDDLPVQLKYGFNAEDKSSYNLNLGFEFPLPVFPAIVIKLGGGMNATNARSYQLANGYWVKGYPYLQTEQPNPPQPGITFDEVMTEIWNNVLAGNVYQELVDVIAAQLAGGFFSWMGGRGQQIDLNVLGSNLVITENSIPATVDSASYRYWQWGEEEPQTAGLTSQQKKAIARYKHNLRLVREQAVGMHYGIGGFFKFEPGEEEWNDDPLLTIVYPDSAVAGIDENTLGIYWEDNEGTWQPLASTVVPDSNLVRAHIPYFTTYTLAPRLPQGSLNLQLDSDSLAADGSSTVAVSASNILNNDGTPVSEGALFTVFTNRGTILTDDSDPTVEGIQAAVQSGTASFEVQSDMVALPIVASMTSTEGFASGIIEIPLYDIAPPQTPALLTIQPEHRALRLTWETVDDPDLAGYRIWFDTDQSGAPYNGNANSNGENSPVTVGITDSYTITGLNNDETYYVTITAVDVSGKESAYANELQARPMLNAVSNLQIVMTDTGAKLSWEAAYGAESYRVYRSDAPNAPLAEMELVANTQNLTWTDAEAPAADSYFYVVVSVAF